MILLDYFSANLVLGLWMQWYRSVIFIKKLTFFRPLIFVGKDHPPQKLADYNEQDVLTWLFVPPLILFL